MVSTTIEQIVRSQEDVGRLTAEEAKAAFTKYGQAIAGQHYDIESFMVKHPPAIGPFAEDDEGTGAEDILYASGVDGVGLRLDENLAASHELDFALSVARRAGVVHKLMVSELAEALPSGSNEFQQAINAVLNCDQANQLGHLLWHAIAHCMWGCASKGHQAAHELLRKKKSGPLDAAGLAFWGVFALHTHNRLHKAGIDGWGPHSGKTSAPEGYDAYNGINLTMGQSWKSRSLAVCAMHRLNPQFICQDVSAPPILRMVYSMAATNTIRQGQGVVTAAAQVLLKAHGSLPGCGVSHATLVFIPGFYHYYASALNTNEKINAVLADLLPNELNHYREAFLELAVFAVKAALFTNAFHQVAAYNNDVVLGKGIATLNNREMKRMAWARGQCNELAIRMDAFIQQLSLSDSQPFAGMTSQIQLAASGLNIDREALRKALARSGLDGGMQTAANNPQD